LLLNICVDAFNLLTLLRSINLSRHRRSAARSNNVNSFATQQDNTVVSFNSYVQRQKTVHLIPKSINQETYIDLLTDDSKCIVFATGPAGTGKTMLAMLAGIRAFKEGAVSKLILTRPAVGVDDERHGFLPGDINAKMEPWTRPLFDVIAEYYSPKEVARMLEEQVIEIAPLAFMRGRTFKGCWIVADEMQNATPGQIKMLLTRLGEGSKIVVTGDTRQADRRDPDNGLLDFKRLFDGFKNSKYIAGVEFATKDIARHPAVAEVLRLYGED
jgi:phosphate starvation-inducible protein PhoH and related proteins